MKEGVVAVFVLFCRHRRLLRGRSRGGNWDYIWGRHHCVGNLVHSFLLSVGVRSAVSLPRSVGVQFDLVLLIAVSDGREFRNGLPRKGFQLGFWCSHNLVRARFSNHCG